MDPLSYLWNEANTNLHTMLTPVEYIELQEPYAIGCRPATNINDHFQLLIIILQNSLISIQNIALKHHVYD